MLIKSKAYFVNTKFLEENKWHTTGNIRAFGFQSKQWREKLNPCPMLKGSIK